MNYQGLEKVDNEEVKTQVHVFHEHKEEDAEEFHHRYDNIRIDWEYPFTNLLIVSVNWLIIV